MGSFLLNIEFTYTRRAMAFQLEPVCLALRSPPVSVARKNGRAKEHVFFVSFVLQKKQCPEKFRALFDDAVSICFVSATEVGFFHDWIVHQFFRRALREDFAGIEDITAM